MKRFFLGLSCFTFVLFYGGLACAQGLDRPLIVKSKYFSVYGERSINMYAVLKKLNFEYLIYAENLLTDKDDLGNMLAKSIDGLYMAVSDILDIHIYNYHGKLMIFPDRASLNEYLRQSYGLNLSERSYYFHKDNTIYISFADLTAGVLGHEMGHAIVSLYFVVPPPVKVQEILCGYVEYSLRRTPAVAP
ncbi:MAG: hypothetical protein ABIG31_00850 [Candidatus Omnitrophota bacterium]